MTMTTDKVDTTGPAIAKELNESLSANYMLVTMKIARWSASKRDVALGNKVSGEHGADVNAVSATKKLMVGADAELKAVNTALNSIRTHLYENSLPWSGDTKDLKGPRIVPTKASITLLKDLGVMEKEFNTAMRTFKKVYDTRRTAALSNLGTLADAGLYPDASDLDTLFSVSIDLVPVPSVSGFGNMNIPAPMAQALGKRMAQRQQKIVDNAMTALQERVLDTVTNLSDQLHKSADGEGTRLFESLSGNLKPLVTLIDAASLSKDKRLIELKKEIDELSKVDIKSLKKAKPAAKRAVAQKADKVVKTLSKPPQVNVDEASSEILF